MRLEMLSNHKKEQIHFKSECDYIDNDGNVVLKIDSSGIKHWRNKQGQLHRVDGPAVELANGDKFWYLNGKCHREDGPAIEYASGNKSWWINDRRHREDGPALEWANGDKEWWVNGRRLTISEFLSNNSASKCAVDKIGNKFWYNYRGQLHRMDGPAIEYADGGKSWYQNNKLHRIKGPAVKCVNGDKYWYQNG